MPRLLDVPYMRRTSWAWVSFGAAAALAAGGAGAANAIVPAVTGPRASSATNVRNAVTVILAMMFLQRLNNERKRRVRCAAVKRAPRGLGTVRQSGRAAGRARKCGIGCLGLLPRG